jgi:hypothetical protein
MNDQSMHAGYAVARQEPMPTPSALSELGLVESRLGDLHTVIDELTKHLCTVLTPEPPTAAGGSREGSAGSMTSDLTQRLKGVLQGLDLAVLHLGRMNRRVEL